MPKAYISALSGGLGNQMFQYAVGRSLSLRHGVPLLLDTRMVEQDALRAYALSGFRIQADIAAPSQLPPKLGRIGRRLRWLPRWMTRRAYVFEKGFAFDRSMLAIRPPAHLSGNWQSEKYFANSSDVIRSDFELAQPLTPERQAVADAIAGINAVSVHVRRGDYLSNPVANAYHGTCEPAWYALAKQKIEQTVRNPSYVVFSDDPDWARANLHEFVSAKFVAPLQDGSDEQDLHLMARCRHHIIANSSFSWWGAWLNPRADKVVIAPAQWFRAATHDTSDLIPSGWQRL